VFVCSQLQHTYSAVFLLLVTAASDLLVHKILLNSVLLSPIVSGGLRPKPPGQTPIGHNPLVCCHAAKNGVMTKGVVSGGLTSLRLRRITSSPSQTLRRHFVRTTNDGRCGECLTLAAVRRGFIVHTSRLVWLTTMQRSQIFVQNRVICLPHLHSTPPLAGFPSEYCHPVWRGKN